MLSRSACRARPARLAARAAVLGVALKVGSAAADAGPLPAAVHRRQALTAGGYDHFLGQLAPGGEEIYFAANASSTVEIFVQNLSRGFPRRLFDDAADTNQPRLSPDGTRLLYISYRHDAGGDACIFDLRKRSRRCLTGPGTAVLHVFWFPDGSAGVLTRTRLDADHRLYRMRASGGRSELVLERNMSAPAISPDGRWLAYVPLERPEGESRPGSLMRSSHGLMLHRLDGSGQAIHLVPELPGTSSFPAFSRDGDHLYFTQYLNDSNFDGIIDGSDNGVLFRIPFRNGEASPIGRATPQQLTSGRSNCQYPAPARHRLVATCARAGFLQLYAIPLEGVVPSGLSRERIEGEIKASRDPWEQLLLLQRLLSLEKATARRAELYRRVVIHHVALREYESAEHYLALLAASPEGSSLPPGWIAVQREIVAHRRAEQRLGHGKLTGAFITAQRARLHRLDGLAESAHPSARRLARLAMSEIHLVLGDRAAAMDRFAGIDIEDETDKAVLQAWARQAEALLRDLGDRERWLHVQQQLAEHPALEERDRLYHASAFIGALRRGRTPGEELPLVERARSRVADGTELALMLDLEAALLRVPARGQQVSEAHLDRLWNAAATFERHRAVAMETIRRAAQNDWGRLLHAFGRRWLEDVPPDHPERKYAEALYAEVMLERAYVELDRGRVAEARELFSEITEAVAALEAHVGYIETSRRQGIAPSALLHAVRRRFARADPVRGFAEAYILARELPEIRDPARHEAEIERIRARLRPVAQALPRSTEVQHLYAYLAHRQYHRTGDKEAAMAAHARYHLALDLAPDDPRRRASLLLELGLLQAALGNHRIALKHFAERERLPFRDPASELSFRLARARSLFHAASYAEAKVEIARAMARCKGDAELRRFLPLIVDRAALYHYAAGAHEDAVRLYSELVGMTSTEPLAARMKARLGLGAAALAAGRTGVARSAILQSRALLDADEPFRPSRVRQPDQSHLGRDDYRPLLAGLLAGTHRAAGDLRGAAAALEERYMLYRERYRRYRRDAYLLELARIAYQLAETAYRLGEPEAARAHLERALEQADAWRSRTSTELDEVSLAIVRAAAELHLYGKVPLSSFGFDVRRRLSASYRHITRRPNPKFAAERFLFPIYLTLLDLPPEPYGTDPSASVPPSSRSQSP